MMFETQPMIFRFGATKENICIMSMFSCVLRPIVMHNVEMSTSVIEAFCMAVCNFIMASNDLEVIWITFLVLLLCFFGLLELNSPCSLYAFVVWKSAESLSEIMCKNWGL